MENRFIALILILLTFPLLGFSQEVLPNDLQYEVNKVYPPFSISRAKLHEACTLNALHEHFKPSWVRAYFSVEILTLHNGQQRKAVSSNDTLTQEQQENMNMADMGSDISVVVQYMPENTLTHNDPKEYDFAFTVEPEIEAKYAGGQQQLNRYIKENAIDKIASGSFKNYDLTAINFTIDEEGQIIDVHVFGSMYQTYKNEKINELLLEAIQNMPKWEPAEYSNGKKEKQKFILTVGNMENCVTNLLNIRKD